MYPKNILLQKNHLLSLTLALLATLVMGLLWPNLALADGPITVTTTIDEFNIGTDCSLREAIQTANHDSDFGGCTHSGTAPYTIILTDGTYVLTNTGTGDDANIQGDLDISATMTISGTGANKTIINGNTSDRVFHIASSGVATLSHLSVVSGTTTLLIGSCPDDDLCGGGAYVGTGGALTVLTSTFSSNTAAVGGGGIFNYQGSVAMTNTTFSSNTARRGGGFTITKAM
ncbi:MAG: CSLREA domain-containing protein [Chloroflexi bacterium]|nr:CSLREA domain-containing protein [Chloroflexota bacterium]